MIRNNDGNLTMSGVIPQWMAKLEVPGVSVAVIEKGQPVRTAAYGVSNRRAGPPVTDT